jgi:hypothetical protein
MNYEYFYPGTAYSLDSKYGSVFTGYRIPAGQLGATTSIQTANQVKEVTNLLNQGIKTVEVSTIQPEVFEAIPKQHLKELNRIAKLTNSSASVHAPLVEASGYTKEGWDEAAREQAQLQMWNAVDKAHEISPKGNIPVTFHASAMLPLAEEKMKGKDGELSKSMYVVDSRTGEIAQIKEKEKFFPEEIPKEYIKKHNLSEADIKKRQTGKFFDPQLELNKINEETFTKRLNDANYYASLGEERLDNIMNIPEMALKKQGITDAKEIAKKESEFIKSFTDMTPEQVPEELRDTYTKVTRGIDHGKIFLRDSYNQLRELYNKAYKDASEEDKKKLDAYRKEIQPLIDNQISKNPDKLKDFSEKVIHKGIKVLSSIDQPKLYVPLNDFLIEKSSETFGNVAFEAYKKFGEKAPIISIENPPTDNALSRADDLKKLIQESRKQFVEKAKAKGLTESEAKSAAEKLIGATWDTSHIAMIRKFGFNEKDLIKEAEKIAPFVKHVHYNDNFGSAHTDLPPGMGSVPIKEIMQKLEEAGFKGKKIFEGGGFFQNFQTSPHPYVLEGSGSPLSSGRSPYWNQMPAYGNYFSFPSSYFPEQHFSLYGGGFSTIPMELGGQAQGKGSRMSGTPMD